MTALNRREDFPNLNDTLDDLDAGLTRTFESHEIQVQGAVAIFAVHAPAEPPPQQRPAGEPGMLHQSNSQRIRRRAAAIA
jgi:hypothetical protein